MHIHCFQHAHYEAPGNILEWTRERGHTISYTRFYEKELDYSGLRNADLLLVMGGAMNVDEEQRYPWLVLEKQLIRERINSGGKVLGICLGAQLIASALGSRVYRASQKEIGFFPVDFMENGNQDEPWSVFPKQLMVFHWHGDTFDLPKGAKLMASTAAVPHQAFIVNNAVGFQFHPEANRETVQGMLKNDGHDLQNPGKYVQTRDELLQSLEQQGDEVKKIFFEFLDRFVRA